MNLTDTRPCYLTGPLPATPPSFAYAYLPSSLKPSAKTLVRKLSATELATVRIELKEAPDYEYAFSHDLCLLLSVGLHYKSNWPDHQNVRSPLEFGWPYAELCASLLSVTSRPLDVWIGWDALRMLDERDDLGVQVHLDADSSLTAPGRIRLRDRLAEIAKAAA